METLHTECSIPLDKIVCVATKVDQFHAYQVTETDLEDFVNKTKTCLCLVNNHAGWEEEHSVYTIIEELSERLL